MSDSFTPYWLIHEPGKKHGFSTVKDASILTPEEAIARWRVQDAEDIRVFGLDTIEVAARLITKPNFPR